MASADLVVQCSLILLTKLWKGDVNFPGEVSAVVSGVDYDGTDFTEFTVVSKEM